ncbi:hypothetical protein PV328_000709 [Microctonus aethiopoides]|uniref:Uncharacterized protein n=1 Tax=Microctonus aethiopoides TaxID=144406 RepID=A0AA39KWQ7_9HYME|nr:hypothetical protein PV328_000709 [Microctonus aethiopoides]
MKNYGALILMATAAILLFPTSEVSSAPRNSCAFCPYNWLCDHFKCYHPCESPIEVISQPCGQHARCNKRGQSGAQCVCSIVGTLTTYCCGGLHSSMKPVHH